MVKFAVGVLWPKYHNINAIWALKPCSLGPWTLKALLDNGKGLPPQRESQGHVR